MPARPSFEDLEKQAEATVAAVRDDPKARLALRERFYSKYGGDPAGGPGLGRSELDFMRWEIERGVLAPASSGGSPWWREVNERVLYHAELASLVQEHLPDLEVGMGAVRFWQQFIREPGERSWYRAHNASIAIGYLDYFDLAHAEPWSERVFVNIVLYRLLYAQGLVEGVELGALGAILANPRLPTVELLLELPAFYPRNYVLTRAEVRDILQKGHSLDDAAEAIFDDLFIIPELTELYRHASGWLGLPGLEALVALGRPSYPGDPIDPRPHDDDDDDAPPSPGVKKKIAILGGGLASLSAAYELTSYPGWRDRYEITLYQVGWRVGGKTTSGFGTGDRIEERGIHIFQGWYNNAFRMVRDAYEYADKHRLSPNSPLRKWTDAFIPDDATLFTEYDTKRGAWTNWPVLIPYNDKLPGEEGPPPIGQVLKEGLGLIAELLLGSPYAKKKPGCLSALLSPWVIRTFFSPPWDKSTPDWWKHATALADDKHEKTSESPELRWLHQARDLVATMHQEPTLQLGALEVSALRVATTLFAGFVEFLKAIGPEDRAEDDRLEHIVVLAEFGLANLRGLLEDIYDERTHQFDFHRVNRFDYRDWLRRHQLPADFVDCAPVRFLYCGAFHNLYRGEPGKLAADLGLRSLLASVTYRGSLVWKLAAGTGGSLTAPIFKMLEHRGVRFAFFHEVEEIHWSPSGQIEAMTVGIQVDLRQGVDRYAPLKSVKHVDGWPSHPHYDQLDPEQARRLVERRVDLESPWADWAPVRTRTLRRGLDFDDIVNGIPIRATQRICAGIVARNADWKNMVDHVRTTPTLGVQLWLRPTLGELGMELPKWGMDEGDEPNSVIYADLLYSWTDMGLVMPFEGWRPDAEPGQLSYYCGTWAVKELAPYSDHEFPAREHERLLEYSREWLGKNMGWFFPRAIRPTGEFDFTLLVDPSDPDNVHGVDGERKLRSQWFTVNMAPSEQYTLAWPGTDQYRLRPDGSGFSNLFLAGDWTNFGLNIGHVEGAVTSGLKAAQGLLKSYGQTDLREVFADIGIPGADSG